MTAPVPFDGVFKMGGVRATASSQSANTGWVKITEVEQGIFIDSAPETSTAYAKGMTIAEARSLAAQIMELARRHEVRLSKAPNE